MESLSFNIVNANIISLDKEKSSPESLTIKNGFIESIDKLNPSLKTINCHGATIIPGFIDSHFHLRNLGKRLDMIQLKGINSLEKIKTLVMHECKKKKSGEIILGFGWDQNLWEGKNFPESDFLNNLAPENPVYFTRIDGHASWVNNVAIAKTNISIKQIHNIDGGKVINDCIMIDNSMGPFKNYLPQENKEQVKKWIYAAALKASQMGITGVHDAWQDKNAIEAIMELIQEKQFPIRCYGMLASNDLSLLNTYFKAGHYNNDYYTIRSVKAFITEEQR